MMNSKYYNGNIVPLTMILESYGDKLSKFISTYFILKFDLNPKGIL